MQLRCCLAQLQADSGPVPAQTVKPVLPVTWTDVGRLVLPALCSCGQMIVQGLGLRYISASTSLVLSGSAILFTAALSMIFLRSRLNALHCWGTLLTKPLSVMCLSTACPLQCSLQTHQIPLRLDQILF